MEQIKDPRRSFGALTWPAYVIGLMLVLKPVVEASTAVASFEPGAIAWRVQSVGFLSGFFLTPVLGLFLLFATSYLMQHRRVLRSLSVLCGLAALVLVAVMLFFTLDVLQMRNLVRPEAMLGYYFASGRALLNLGMGFAALAVIAVSGIRNSRAERSSSYVAERGAAENLVVVGSGRRVVS